MGPGVQSMGHANPKNVFIFSVQSKLADSISNIHTYFHKYIYDDDKIYKMLGFTSADLFPDIKTLLFVMLCTLGKLIRYCPKTDLSSKTD